MSIITSFYYQCPHCKSWLVVPNYAPRDKTNVDYWTDGRIENFGKAEEEWKILRCPDCINFFWTDEVKEYEDFEIPAIKNKALDLTEFYLPKDELPENFLEVPVKFYLKALENELDVSVKHELYIRLKLLWAINDISRYLARFKEKAFVKKIRYLKNFREDTEKIKNLLEKYQELKIFNLKRILKIGIGIEALLKAEIHRYLENFDESLSILENIKSVTIEDIKQPGQGYDFDLSYYYNWEKAIKTVRYFCEKKNKHVQIL